MKNQTYAVIVPTHKRLKLLKQALQSIAAQSISPVEVIVVDDANESWDGKEFETIDLPELKVIKNTAPLGGAGSRNVGLEAITSSPDFVGFLDDDDEWIPDKMEKQINFLLHNSEYIACSCGRVKEISSQRHDEVPSANSIKNLWPYENVYGSFSAFCLKRTEVSRGIRVTSGLRSCQDWDFYLSISRFGKIGFIHEPLSLYRVHEGERISSNFRSKSIGFNQFRSRWASKVEPRVNTWWCFRSLASKPVLGLLALPIVSSWFLISPKRGKQFLVVYLQILISTTIGERLGEALVGKLLRLYSSRQLKAFRIQS